MCYNTCCNWDKVRYRKPFLFKSDFSNRISEITFHWNQGKKMRVLADRWLCCEIWTPYKEKLNVLLKWV